MAGQVLPLEDAGVTVGRDLDSGLRLDGYSQVSRKHARLVWDGSRFLVEDSNSTNGVTVEGVRVQRAALMDGNLVQFGDCTARFTFAAPKSGGFKLPDKLAPLLQSAGERWKKLPGTQAQKSVASVLVGLVLLLGFAGMRARPGVSYEPSHSGSGNNGGPMTIPDAPAAPANNGNQGTAPVLAPVNGKIDPKALQNAEKGTVLILHNEGQSYTMGSGFALDNPRQIITNRHVVVDDSGNPQPLMLIFESGTPRARQVRVSADHVKLAPSSGDPTAFQSDLALISLDGDQVPALPSGASEDLTETDQVYAVGFPLGTQTLTVDGALPSVSVKASSVERLQREANNAVNVIQIGSTVTHGNSGGPLVDTQGRVVGVISRAVEGTGMSYAIPMQYVKRLVAG